MREIRYTPGGMPAIVTARLAMVFAGSTAEATARAVLALTPEDPSLEAVLDTVVAPGIATAPDFVVCAVADDGAVTAILRGALRLQVQTADDVRDIDAAGVRTWREAIVPGAIALGIAGPDWHADPLHSPDERDRIARPGPLAVARLTVETAVPAPPADPVDPSRTLDFAEAVGPSASVSGTAALSPVLAVPEPPRGAAAAHLSAPAGGPALRPAVAAGLEALASSPTRYDELFGATVNFGVEAAAVRADEETAADASAAASASDHGDEAAGVPALVGRCGHANPIERSVCSACGAPLAGATTTRVTHPDLGALVLPDGTEVALGGVVLVGRSPRADRTAGHGLPALVTIDDRDVSRTHVRIRSEGWRVLVEDLDSTNGTLLIGADGTPRRLRTGEPAIVFDGALVDVGGTRLRFTRIP